MPAVGSARGLDQIAAIGMRSYIAAGLLVQYNQAKKNCSRRLQDLHRVVVYVMVAARRSSCFVATFPFFAANAVDRDRGKKVNGEAMRIV